VFLATFGACGQLSARAELVSGGWTEAVGTARGVRLGGEQSRVISIRQQLRFRMSAGGSSGRDVGGIAWPAAASPSANQGDLRHAKIVLPLRCGGGRAAVRRRCRGRLAVGIGAGRRRDGRDGGEFPGESG